MAQSPQTGLAFLDDQQAGAETRHNLALRQIEVFIGHVENRTTTTPPAHADGNAWIVGSGATGDWAGKDNQIAISVSSAWEFLAPVLGEEVYLQDESIRVRWDGSAWVSVEAVLADGTVAVARTLSAASGTEVLLTLSPTINQSGDASYTGLLIEATETTTGSGSKLLINAKVGVTSMFSVDNAGQVTCKGLGVGDAPSDLVHVTAAGNANALRVTDSTGNLGIKAAPHVNHAVWVDGSFYINQSGTAANRPVLTLDQKDTDADMIRFDGTVGTFGQNSLSSDTGTTGAKTGAIQIKINGVVRWLWHYGDSGTP